MERKKPLSDATTESDKAFLDRTGVGVQIRDVLTKIIENRPEDPVAFLADYFECQGGNLDRVAKAHQQLLTAHYTKPAFHSNLRSAYEMLSFHKNTDKVSRRRKDRGKTLKGVTGQNYMDLLTRLCSAFPARVRDELMKKIRCADHEVIPFDVFQSSMFTCLVLAEFLEQARDLYKSLDTQNTDKVDKVICETVNVQLYRAVTKSEEDPTSVLEAGVLLGPEKVYSSLATAMFNNSKGYKQTMSCEEFLVGASESFLSKVNRLQ